MILECLRRKTLWIPNWAIWVTDEGVEADIHNEGVSLREVLESSNEQIGDDADNIDDLKGEEFSPAEGNGVVQLVGAPDGWVPREEVAAK